MANFAKLFLILVPFMTGIGCASTKSRTTVKARGEVDDYVLSPEDSERSEDMVNFLSSTSEIPAPSGDVAAKVPGFAFMPAPTDEANAGDALFPPVVGSLDEAIGKAEAARAPVNVPVKNLSELKAKKRFTQLPNAGKAH